METVNASGYSLIICVWRIKETETKMPCMVRIAPPMSQSDFDDDNGGES
jgi:hypothetical protein